MNAGLTFRIVWWDDDILEIAAVATNGRFSASAQFFADTRSFDVAADAISGFPTSHDDRRECHFGNVQHPQDDGGLVLRFSCLDGAGHCAVAVDVRHVPRTGLPIETASFVIRTEAASVDNFVRAMRTLALTRQGEARLNGIRTA